MAALEKRVEKLERKSPQRKWQVACTYDVHETEAQARTRLKIPDGVDVHLVHIEVVPMRGQSMAEAREKYAVEQPPDKTFTLWKGAGDDTDSDNG